MDRLGVITGITREAKTLSVLPASQRPLVRSSGARSDRAYRLSQTLIKEGCNGLVSFGTAGGLTADLRPGALIVPEKIISADGQIFLTSGSWRKGIGQAVGGILSINPGPMAGSNHVVVSEEAKRALAVETSAVAVDMESHAVGLAAQEADVPFIVVRAVADPLSKAIPEWVLGNISENGDTRYGAILMRAVMNPGDWTAFMELARNSAKAMSTLRCVAGLAGPLFCFR